MTWRQWGLQQLAGLAAVVVGLVAATLVVGDGWGVGTWLIFLAAWVVVTAVSALIRARSGSPQPD